MLQCNIKTLKYVNTFTLCPTILNNRTCPFYISRNCEKIAQESYWDMGPNLASIEILETFFTPVIEEESIAQ